MYVDPLVQHNLRVLWCKKCADASVPRSPASVNGLEMPEKTPSLWLIAVALLLVCFWWVPLYYAVKSERNACEKTETCEVCSVTSTGFPYCKPDPK